MASRTELRRRNSIAAATTTIAGPTKLSIQSSSSFPPSLTLELTSLNTTDAITTSSNSYTSLRDIIPSSPLNSPSSAVVGAGNSVAIRNRLVKQAAWAYLQPMSASPSSDGPRFLRRLWLRCADADSSCLGFFACHVITAVDHLIALFHVPAEVR